MGEAINMIMTEDQAITGMFSLQQKWRNNTKTSVSSTTMSAFCGPHISYLLDNHGVCLLFNNFHVLVIHNDTVRTDFHSNRVNASGDELRHHEEMAVSHVFAD